MQFRLLRLSLLQKIVMHASVQEQFISFTHGICSASNCNSAPDVGPYILQGAVQLSLIEHVSPRFVEHSGSISFGSYYLNLFRITES